MAHAAILTIPIAALARGMLHSERAPWPIIATTKLGRKVLTSWASNAPATGVTVPTAIVTEPATARVTELALQRPTKLFLFASPTFCPPHPMVQSGQVQIQISPLRQRRMRQHQQRRNHQAGHRDTGDYFLPRLAPRRRRRRRSNGQTKARAQNF